MVNAVEDVSVSVYRTVGHSGPRAPFTLLLVEYPPWTLCVYMHMTIGELWGTKLTPGNEMSVRSLSLQFSSLPPELVTIVAEHLDPRSLANFAAASTACLAAAQNELRVALTAAVQRCLLPGRSCRGMDKLVASPHFRLPDDLVAIPAGAFMHCTSLTQLTIPATVATIGNGALAAAS